MEDLTSTIYILTGNQLRVSEDEGETWLIRNIPGSGSLAQDNSGRIYHRLTYSTDKGITWNELPTSGLEGGVNVMGISKNNRIYIGNSKGIFYGEADSIVVSVENNELLKTFYLSQNYPNPFNPVTKIKYEIPASLNPSKGGTLVQLVVYDILGREVAVLVNEEKQSGDYEIEFDGSSLSSGIYLYRLTAGEFSATKKLVLLK